MADNQLISLIRKHAHPLEDKKNKYEKLLEEIGDASIVLLGESTHGTHEFYAMRTEITYEQSKYKLYEIISCRKFYILDS